MTILSVATLIFRKEFDPGILNSVFEMELSKLYVNFILIVSVLTSVIWFYSDGEKTKKKTKKKKKKKNTYVHC